VTTTGVFVSAVAAGASNVIAVVVAAAAAPLTVNDNGVVEVAPLNVVVLVGAKTAVKECAPSAGVKLGEVATPAPLTAMAPPTLVAPSLNWMVPAGWLAGVLVSEAVADSVIGVPLATGLTGLATGVVTLVAV
jgi:hypothetical protein